MADRPNERRLGIQIAQDLHIAVMTASAKMGITFRQFCINALNNELDKNKNGAKRTKQRQIKQRDLYVCEAMTIEEAEVAYDTAPSVPLSCEQIDKIVRRIVGADAKGDRP